MNNATTFKFAAAVFATAIAGSAVFAQPSPVIGAPAASSAPSAAQATPAPNQIIYAPRLPSAAELSSAAAAQGLSIDKIDQTGSQITVVYRLNNGQLNVVSYQLLPTTDNAAATVPTAPQVVEAPPAPSYSPSTTVVYAPPPPPQVVYYEEPVYYRYPSYWYPPVSFRLGLGFHSGGYHGSYRGSYHGHHR
jgi:hypothetical protein